MPCSMRKISIGRLRARLAAISLSLLILAGGLIGCEAEGPDRPNLMLITTSRLAADRLSCFGGASDAGGSICALGRRGTLFAWTASSGRGEASSAATVLTGLPEAGHGIAHDGQSFLVDAQPSIAKDLSKAGYATAAFVTSSRLNSSRRLDQGFDLYDDRLASPSRSGGAGSVDLSDTVRSWIETAPAPWFIWIHADREAGLVDLDRLLSRLSQTLDVDQGGPGILFLALRGEGAAAANKIAGAASTIDWRTHRVPLIWRPPTAEGPAPPGVSRRLASLIDIAPTLRAAARLPRPRPRRPGASPVPPDDPADALRIPPQGRDLSRLALPRISDPMAQDRLFLLDTLNSDGEIGLASTKHLYTRRKSPLDGTGRPVPTSLLVPLAARFATLPEYEPPSNAAPGSARLQPSAWRSDVLAAQSPVPRLEFHLARQLSVAFDARTKAKAE
jgi:hypothetical protein